MPKRIRRDVKRSTQEMPADQMVYQTEKFLSENGDKIDSSDRDEINAKLEALREALKGSNIDDIKAKQQELTNKFYDVSAKIYQQAGGQDASQQAQGAQGENGEYNGSARDVTDDQQ